MKAFWSRIARELSPYVPGEQPRIANLVKLNTNESPFGPSPLALEAMRAAAVDTLRLYSLARRQQDIATKTPHLY
jgi:histidinol-phosphate aminotransferase